MMKDIFQGKLVSLVAEDPQVVANAYTQWHRNAEFKRLLDADPAILWSANKIKEWLEKEMEAAKKEEEGAEAAIPPEEETPGAGKG